jgi:hypothetical protein
MPTPLYDMFCAKLVDENLKPADKFSAGPRIRHHCRKKD